MITLAINKTEVDKLLKKFGSLAGSEQAKTLFSAFNDSGALMARSLKNNVRGRFLKVLTGALSKSISYKVVTANKDLSAIIGSGVAFGRRLPYANIHELGETIRPKRSKYLTIPLSGALTSRGVPRFTASMLSRGLVAGYRNSFVKNGCIFGIKNNSGNYYNTQIVPLFALKKSVTIPARNYLSKTINENKNSVIKIFVEKLNRALQN